jgi:cell shape-determining protein MreC
MYYQKKNKKKGDLFFFLIILIIIGLGVFGIVWPQNFSRYILSPVFNIRNFVLNPIKNIGTSFKDKNELQNRINELEEENTQLKIANLSQSFVNSQIEDYKIELEKKTQGSISKVLNRPPFSPYDTLLVLKGSNEINLGDLVFVHGVYIGDIESVDRYTATVKLRSASDQKTLVRVSNIEIEAEGRGSGQFTIRVPKDVEISEGEPVVVPELNYSLLGAVGHIVSEPGVTFKTVYFSIPVAFQNMNFVSIVPKFSVLE